MSGAGKERTDGVTTEGEATVGERRDGIDDNETARWLGESGDLVSRHAAAVGEHTGRMASVNADLRATLARERRRVAALERAIALALDGPSDAEVGMETARGRLAHIYQTLRSVRVADAPGQGGEGAGQ